MIRYRADWVLPVSRPPISKGWVSIDNGVIADVGESPVSAARNLGRVAILPALVNAHIHLELSHLRGIVPPAGRFIDWIRGVMNARQRFPDARDSRILDAARAAIREVRASGTGLVGDISNTLISVPLLREAGLAARVFYELLGFNTPDPVRRIRDAREALDSAGGDARVRLALAPHAPCSVSPGLFAAIRHDLEAHADAVSTVHLGESVEEVELLAHGKGGWRDLLTELGAWTDTWQVPSVSPVQYLAGLGFLDRRVLAVHGVQCSGDDLARLRTLGVTLVSCPRSNRHVGVGDPPIEAFYAMGVSVAFGTDSLASVESLNMFTELHTARRIAPKVPARHLLESATLCGARALGFGDEFGSIERGKQAALIAVDVPDGVDDVEEYLLTGIGPSAIRWVSS